MSLETVQNNEVGVTADPEENPLLRKMQEEVSYAETYWAPTFRKVQESRRFARGTFVNDAGERTETRINLAYSTIRSMIPHIFAEQPDIAIGPDDGVPQFELPALKKVSGLIEIAVSRSLRQGGLKRLAKACTLAALTSDASYAKVTYQRNYRKDPAVTARREDTQDEIAKLDDLLAKVEDPELHEQHDLRKAELMQLMKSLDEEEQVLVSQGIALDRVMTEHLLPDPSIQQWENFYKSPALTQIIYKTKDAAEAWLGIKLERAKMYPVSVLTEGSDVDTKTAQQSQHLKAGTTKNVEEPLVKIYERWDSRTKTVYTWVEGECEWAREPYSPKRLGKRWYPFFDLVFFPSDGMFWPIGLIDLIKPLQNEYNDVRNDQAEVRTASVPRYLTSSSTDRDTIDHFTVAGKYEVIQVKGQPGVPISDIIKQEQPPHYNPQLYDVSQVRVDVDMMTGVSDVARGAVQKTKTLGEAQLLQANLSSSANQHRDTIETWIEDIAHYTAEILLQELSPVEAAKLTNAQALESWPTLDRHSIWNQVKLEIRAGTTGKPDLPEEREAWAQGLPVIMQLQDKIAMVATQGMDPTPWVELLKRTVTILDSRIDVDALIPRVGPPPQLGLGEMMAGAVDGGGAPAPANVVPISEAAG